jgi:hypothetical protein
MQCLTDFLNESFESTLQWSVVVEIMLAYEINSVHIDSSRLNDVTG